MQPHNWVLNHRPQLSREHFHWSLLPGPLVWIAKRVRVEPQQWTAKETVELGALVAAQRGKWDVKAAALGTGRAGAAVQSRWKYLQKNCKKAAGGASAAPTMNVVRPLPPLASTCHSATLRIPTRLCFSGTGA